MDSLNIYGLSAVIYSDVAILKSVC